MKPEQLFSTYDPPPYDLIIHVYPYIPLSLTQSNHELLLSRV